MLNKQFSQVHGYFKMAVAQELLALAVGGKDRILCGGAMMAHQTDLLNDKHLECHDR